MNPLDLTVPPIAWSSDEVASVEQVPVVGRADFRLRSHWRHRVMVDVIHDGWVIPAEFLVDTGGHMIPPDAFHEQYVEERDWGAAMVAASLAKELGVGSYTRVNIARVLMDFGRFPGSTAPRAQHLDRFAINYPFSQLLGHRAKRRLLTKYYDPISESMDQLVRSTRVKIAVHTYDMHNRNGTLRPQVSLVTSALGEHTEEVPLRVFDPLYPAKLGEFSCNRVLRDRISLTLEKSSIPVAHNYPYRLPEGGTEVRAQVWSYFNHLKQAFDGAFGDAVQDPSYQVVWDMLLDTNLRSTDSAALRSYLHLYRRAPEGKRRLFKGAAQAYNRIRKFVVEHQDDLVEAYIVSEERLSCLGIEVRKDLVYDYDGRGVPVAPRWDNVEQIGKLVARAVRTFLHEDLTHLEPGLDGAASDEEDSAVIRSESLGGM